MGRVLRLLVIYDLPHSEEQKTTSSKLPTYPLIYPGSWTFQVDIWTDGWIMIHLANRQAVLATLLAEPNVHQVWTLRKRRNCKKLIQIQIRMQIQIQMHYYAIVHQSLSSVPKRWNCRSMRIRCKCNSLVFIIELSVLEDMSSDN